MNTFQLRVDFILEGLPPLGDIQTLVLGLEEESYQEELRAVIIDIDYCGTDPNDIHVHLLILGLNGGLIDGGLGLVGDYSGHFVLGDPL